MLVISLWTLPLTHFLHGTPPEFPCMHPLKKEKYHMAKLSETIPRRDYFNTY